MEHATIENVKADAEKLSEAARGRLADYLEAFLAPVMDDKGARCPGCDRTLYTGSAVMDALLSSFEWGIAHGDGFCGNCRWPIRMYHFIELDKLEKQRLVFPLAYRCYTDDTHTVEIEPRAHYEKREVAESC